MAFCRRLFTAVDNRTGVYWHATVVEYRYQLPLVRFDIVDQQGSQLTVPVLFHNINDLMLVDEFAHGIGKRERFDATIIARIDEP